MNIKTLPLFLVFLLATSTAFAETLSDAAPLLEIAALTSTKGEAASAAAEQIRGYEHNPEEFRARISCNSKECEVQVYPQELDTEEEYSDWFGCPLKTCATMTYSIQSQQIVETVHWR